MTRRVVVFCALAVIAVADFPFNDAQSHPHWERVRWLPAYVSPAIHLRDVVGNLGLGVPAGLSFAALYAASPAAAGLAVAPVALLAEWSQVYSHSRYPTASDVALNVAGAAIAAAMLAARLRQRAVSSVTRVDRRR